MLSTVVHHSICAKTDGRYSFMQRRLCIAFICSVYFNCDACDKSNSNPFNNNIRTFSLMKCCHYKTDPETMHLELDPESVDYLIPNSGLVGFRFLVHETPEPHWVHHQTAVFLGAQFHTMLRLAGTRKVRIFL